MKKAFSFLISTLLIALPSALVPSSVLAQENFQTFAPAPDAAVRDLGRNAVECLKGVYRLLGSPRSNLDFFQEFRDYLGDFFLWPAHYADVSIIDEQLHRARREAIASIFRCDTERIASTTDAFHKLEAEVYYLRHYVTYLDKQNGTIHVQTVNPGERENFRNAFVKTFAGSTSLDSDRESLLFGASFDEFESKYRQRPAKYSLFAENDAYGVLKKKVEQVVETIESYKEAVNEELRSTEAEINSDITAGVDAADSARSGAVDAIHHPGTALESLGKDAASRFQICPDIGDVEDCPNVLSLGKSAFEKIMGADKAVQKWGEKKTYEEVKTAISQEEIQRTEDKVKGEMLTRYEVLYGQVNGEGLYDLMQRMDGLMKTLGPDSEKGSLAPLEKIAQCAQTVQENECK